MNFQENVKILFYDLETTGLDPERHEIWQIAARLYRTTGDGFELSPVAEGRYDRFVRPLHPETAEPRALEMNRLTVESFADPKFVAPADFTREFKAFLDRHVDRFNPADKIMLAGYNIIKFDNPFLERLLQAHDEEFRKFWPSYFHRACLDVFQWVTSTFVLYTPYENYPRDAKDKVSFKLVDLSRKLKVDLTEETAHDAGRDIEATIECFRRTWATVEGKARRT